jgi:hypothetical protein
VNAARPSGPPLLSYYGVQVGTLHVECICGGMDAVAPLRTRSASSLLYTATLFNQWRARGQESMFIRTEWGCNKYLVTKL